MALTEQNVRTIWEECKTVFQTFGNERLEELLESLVKIVRKYEFVFREKADLDFLNFVVKMDAKRYAVGTNGDNFEMLTDTYIQREELSVEEIWMVVSQLIWDLAVPVTEKICPSCRCDYLVLLVDREEQHLYEACETCFYISENGRRIMRPSDLYPASKEWVICKD